MSTVISIVDYGIGNLLSVVRAFQKCGAVTEFVDTPEGVDRARKLVLPGVGAFAPGIDGLRSRGLIEPLRKYAHSGRPFLGICLGMQLLMDVSEEFGTHEGLGLIRGRVKAIPPITADGQPHKIPHIGWNRLRRPAGVQSWRDTILDEVEEESYAYFVHSYTVEPSDMKYRLADCDYDGQLIAAAVRADNVHGCQFHPEKSGEVGLRVVNRFTVS
jgi:glutamine amidotransferase